MFASDSEMMKCECVCNSELILINGREQLGKLLGYEKTTNNITELLKESDKARFAETFANPVYTEEAYGVFGFVNSAGEKLYMFVNGVYNEDREITLRLYEIERMCRLAKERKLELDMLLDNVDTGIALVEYDDSERMIYSNRCFKDIVSSINGIQSTNLLDVMEYKDAEQFSIMLEDAKKNHSEIDYVFSSKQNDIDTYYRIKSVEIPDALSKKRIFLNMISDITEYTQNSLRVEQLLAERDEVINHIPCALVVFSADDNAKLRYVNNRFYEMFNIDKNAVSLNTFSLIEHFTHKDDLSLVTDMVNKCIESGTQQSCVYKGVDTKGEILWCEVLLNIIKYRNKKPEILAVLIDVTEQKLMGEKLMVASNTFKLAFGQSDTIIWEYDIKDDIAYVSSPGNLDNHEDKQIFKGNKFLEFFHWASIESVEEIERLFEMVRQGESKGSCIVKSAKGNVWKEVSFTMVYDEKGSPTHCVGLIRGMSKFNRMQDRFAQQEALFKVVSAMDNISCLKANLSKNIVLRGIGGKYERLEEAQIVTWDDIIAMDDSNCISTNDYNNNIVEMMSRERLLKGYINGVDSVSFRRQRLFNNGVIKWVAYFVNLVTNPSTGEVYVYGYIRDVDMVVRAELGIDKNPERTSDSKMYTLDTMKSMIKVMEKSCDKSKPVSVVVLELDKKDAKAGAVSVKTYEMIRETIKLVLGDHCIATDLGDERIAIYVAESEDAKQIKKRIDTVISIMETDESIDGGLECSVGICTQPVGKMTFDKMLVRAKALLSKAKENIFTNDDISGKADVLSAGGADTDQSKQKLLIKTADLFSGLEYIDYSINRIIKELGEFYNSDSCCVIELNEKTGQTKRTYVWSREDNSQSQSMAEEVLIDGAPLLSKAYNSGEPVIIKDVQSYDDVAIRERLLEFGQRRMIIMPFKIDYSTYGFICVSNPEKIDEDMSFIKVMAGNFSKEILVRKLKEENNYIRYHDELTGLLNRKSFMSYLENFKPDAIYSLGVASADINSLKRINEQYGTDYGNEMLRGISDCFKAVFDINEVYMFGGDAFTVVCENNSKDAFDEKIDRIIKMVDEKYPDAICMGHTWTDAEIDAEKLINNAEELLMVDKQRFYQKASVSNKYYDPKVGEELKESIARGEYTVFLQPKARTSTGSVAGAEALIRKLDKDDGIIYPNAFVPVFEKQNMIRYIDLFVFEEVFRVLELWKNEGKTLIPISLNFSRSTVLEADILDIMEEIASKYNVDKRFVEIEITESMGSMEIETMKQICSGIKSKGYRIALDDFGTKYSSMAMISAMNFDVIKMDRSITNDILENRTNQILMKNIFSACKEIGIETVTEGVETQAQFDFLKKIGCDYGQGYLFNKAIPWREFEKQYIC